MANSLKEIQLLKVGAQRGEKFSQLENRKLVFRSKDF